MLILHLKRYGFDNFTEEQAKKQDKVKIERFINLSEYQHNIFLFWYCYWGLEIAINTSANGTNFFLLEAKSFGLVVTVMTSFFNVLN